MAGRFVVSPFVAVEWRDGRMLLRCAPPAKTLVVDDPEVVLVLDAFRAPCTVQAATERLDSFDPDDVRQVVAMLRERGALVPEAGDPGRLGSWDPHALYFQQMLAVSLPGARSTPDGRMPPSVKPPMTDHTIALERGTELGDTSLAQALAARRSGRDHARVSMASSSLAALMWNSCRNVQEGEFVRRVYPSGGATYSLEVYLAVSDTAVDGVGGGVYHYCPSRHVLEPLAKDASAAAPFLRATGLAAGLDIDPAVALLVTSRIARVSAKYHRIPLGLVLQEVGCLFQTLYLAATALGLAPCAIGASVGGEELARIAGHDPLDEPVVGRFIVGPRPT